MGSSSWREAAKQLSELRLNQLTRRTPTELLYDLLVYFQNKNQRLLGDAYDWTTARRVDGSHLLFGDFNADGLRVGGRASEDSSPKLGVCFSR